MDRPRWTLDGISSAGFFQITVWSLHPTRAGLHDRFEVGLEPPRSELIGTVGRVGLTSPRADTSLSTRACPQCLLA